jgi:hypothetical protein
MKRFFVAFTGIAVLAAVILVFSSVGYAANPEQECEADGVSTYIHDGPNSTCSTPGEPVGNSDNTKGGSVDTGPGKSEPNEEVTTCTGVNNKPHQCP